MAQTVSAPAAPATPAKAYAFEVVSIRQNKSGSSAGLQEAGPTADGYRMTNMSIGIAMMTAYVPHAGGAAFYNPQDQIKGLPDWMNTERYDIDARISDEDRAEWQKPELQKAMLQVMLQTMLAERCKLAVHREVKEVGVYSLVVAKGGVKFKETDPAAEYPDGQKLPWGGVMVPAPSKDGMSMNINMYGTTMASLASWVSMIGGAGRTIQDKTGLSGRYDVVLKLPRPEGPGQNQTAGASSDPEGVVYSMLVDLGLKLESTKGQVETLVIDHIERPSEN